jgi:hypothetical protein
MDNQGEVPREVSLIVIIKTVQLDNQVSVPLKLDYQDETGLIEREPLLSQRSGSPNLSKSAHDSPDQTDDTIKI